jgi:Rrf2 family iron-sulfur cluster assembly transcriptional regulator
MLNATTKHALKALAFLAKQDREEFIPIEKIAKATSLPREYLAKVIKVLAREGVVESRKGPRGGIRLQPPPKSFSVLDVCLAMKDPIVIESCFIGRKRCGVQGRCAFHTDWSEMRAAIREFLAKSLIS